MPTRKSRRRGEIPGRAYLLLQPPMPQHLREKISGPALGSESYANAPSETSDSVMITPSDRSKAVSQSRITLNCTLNHIEKVLSADSLSEQRFRKARIEQCLNSKSWKAEKSSSFATSTFVSRLDSTLETSDDFKLFLDKRTKLEEERLNRPKPLAGGVIESSRLAVDAVGANSQVTNSENGMPISAILLHLRTKRENESKKRREYSKPKSNGARASTKTDISRNSNGVGKDTNSKRKSKGSTTLRDKGNKADAKAASSMSSAPVIIKQNK